MIAGGAGLYYYFSVDDDQPSATANGVENKGDAADGGGTGQSAPLTPGQPESPPESSSAAAPQTGAPAVARSPAASRPKPETTQQSLSAATPPKAGAGAEAGASTSSLTSPSTPPSAPAPMSSPTSRAPTFDVVRIEKDGSTVMAGRAAAGAEVVITLNDQELGRVTANDQGEWVFLPEQPLPAGNHELSLAGRVAGDKAVMSENVLVVAVPESAPADGRPATEDRVIAGKSPAKDSRAQPTGSAAEPSAGAQALDRSVEAAAVATARGDATAGAGGGEKTSKPDDVIAVLVPRDGAGTPRVVQGPETGLVSGGLILDSITYDEAGRVTFSGRLAGGGQVFIYVDQSLAAQTQGKDDGRWRAQGQQRVALGLHRLRVDQVDPQGKVLARLETPFARSSLLTLGNAQDRMVVVQPGNSLWRIARRAYGQGISYSVVFEANRDQIANPDLIYPGQIFVVPPKN